MKSKKKRFLYLISAMLLLVCIYQLYWLTGMYSDMKERMGKDINEVLRSADFEELAHRVEEISRMKFEGKLDVNMGYDHTDEGTVVKSGVNTPSEETPSRTGTQTVVSPASFGSILKTPDDLIKMGLNMQKGIHLSLDAIKDVDLKYLDRMIEGKLDSIGVGGSHTLLYIRNGEERRYETDTLAKLGFINAGSNDTFRLELPDNAEYQMIIPQWHLAVIRRMMPVIVFSFITLLLLALSLCYMIRSMRKQNELDEIKNDFTNNITHELKTPIAVAYAASDALLNFDATNNTPRIKRYLNICQEQLRLLDRLVEQILSISMERRNSFILNTEIIELDSMIAEICNNFKMKYAGQATYDIEIEPGLVLESDAMHLANIIGNLIDNAIKYSNGVASVGIRAGQDHKNNVIIQISDKGIGISQEQIRHIFDKFYRVPHGNIHDVKGYGLGLFYVKSMTERLGGTVSVTSKLGNGSCFRLKFNSKSGNEKN